MERFFVALTLAVLGLTATTGISEAASDRTEVMVGTGIVVIGVMVLIAIIYTIKHALGLDKMPPAPADDHGAHH